MIETHTRSIVKAVSYRLLGSGVTFIVVLVMTQKFNLAAGIGIIDTLLKIGAFYFHERLWHRIPFGRVKPPDYQI
ncbi:MAG: DUF2061 domain-containing protein [Planctomycetes bacterium]|nr:DUF2061 domain-containing protein [Planctomycetota bacterium]